MNISIDSYGFDKLVACFWHNGDGKWEGVINNNLIYCDAKVIMSDKIILIIRETD